MPLRYLAFLLLVALAAPVGAQENWTSTNGPAPGHVTALAVTPDGTIYAGTYAGVRRSTDRGATWTLAIPHVYARLATALAVAPARHVFVGMSQQDFFEPDTHYGVVRVYPVAGSGTPSYPSGAWGVPGSEVHDIVAAVDGRGWAAIGAEVAAYDPLTDTWTKVALPVERVYDLHRTAAGVMLAATSSGVYRSTTDGASWAPYALAGQVVFAATVGTSGTMFAANQWGIVYRSNNGTTWTPISCGGTVLSLHPQPDGSVIGGTDGFGMVRTVNDGQNWQYAGGTETALRVGGDGMGTAYAIAAGDGLRRSFDGGVSWTALRWIDADVHHLAPLPNGRVVAFTDRYYGAHAYTPSGMWADLGLDGAEVYRAESAGGGLLYALVHRGTFGTAIVRSTDGGATWATRRAFQYYTSFAVADGGVLLASGPDGYERSTDGGATWTAIATPREPSEMHHAGGGVLFSYSGGYPDALLRSADNGLTWENLGSPGFDDDLKLPRLQAVTRTAGGALIAADEDGLMRSDDDGVTWTEVAASPDHVVAFVHDASGTLWAARDEGFFSAAVGIGVWRSPNGGATWEGAGLDGVRVHALAVGTGNTLLAGTATGVYVRSGGVVATSPDPAPTPSALTVAPNPARARAAVTLTLDRAQTATVAVYDALGRRVVTLHDGALAAGTHALSLDAAALPAGLYVVRAVGDGLDLTHRATVVR